MSANDVAVGRGFLRRHKVVAILLALLLTLLGVLVAGAFWVNSQLGGIDRYTSRLAPEDRVAKPTEGPAAEALNILLLGADRGLGAETIEAELQDGEWMRGAFRSDTIMILHLSADRSEAFLVSIPRDSYVPVDGYGKQKINAAFSYGGPDLAVKTIERLTDVYIDHVAIVDWQGFKQLTDAVGGVPLRTSDGMRTLSGDEALAYVRTRKTLPRGDFDRIQRQQNFMRATLQEVSSQGTLTNPVKLGRLLNAVTDNTTVDSGLSTTKMRRLARQMAGAGGDDVTYLTAPVAGLGREPDAGSVVYLDKDECAALWRALREDDMQTYLDQHGGDRLGPPEQVR